MPIRDTNTDTMTEHPHIKPPTSKGQDTTNSTRQHSTRTLTRSRTRGWQKLLPQPNIPHCIPLNKLRCIITLVSLALLVTDIPRTGLGVRNLQEFYPVPLMPSTAVRFGPFNYPVLHIQTANDSETSPFTAFVGTKGDQPVSAARVWSYQYDTTSVGLRGAVELLNVTDFPSFLLYKPQPNQPLTNADSLIDLSTAFNMLDAFIAAALDQLTQPDGTRTTLRYATKHNWVDRIHHYVVRFASKNPAWRLHSLHAPRIAHDTRSLAICSSSNAAGIAHRSSPRPRFCNHPGIWKCKNPIDKSLPAVRLWEHMDLRLQTLQQRYPDLELDVVVLSSQRLSSTSGAMRSTFYNYEALEIVVLTRGRRCTIVTNTSKTEIETSECSTVFVDDYRYERDIVQTNLVDWYGIISFLRGGAQSYVWLRLLLLVYGAYTVAGQSGTGKLMLISRLVSTALIIMKIPFQVIVYSSLLPVVGYVVALLLDSSFMDIFLDSYWASVGGSVNFDLVPFLGTTAVQMRNVWLLASLAILTVIVVRKTRPMWNDGVPGIRGLFISFVSSLTVAGPYKHAGFRDMNNVAIFRAGNGGRALDRVQSYGGGHFNMSMYLFDDSASMLCFCIGAVVALAMAANALGALTPRSSWIHRETQGVIVSSTALMPCGAMMLWPATVLNIRFHVTICPPLKRQGPRVSHIVIPPAKSTLPITRSNQSTSPEKFSVFSRPTTPPKVWPLRSSTTSSDRVGDRNARWGPPHGVQCCTAEYRSILQLMNIAMMTDPWNFFWLRVLGIQLYLYKIHHTQSFGNEVSNSRSSAYTVILPYREAEMEEFTGLSSGDFQLLDSANSRDIPVSVLFQCG